ncbi:MAG: hypothetical protein CMO66_05425 [Verrucomicrobiales bacterium]|nr:hypothetical protein [Verrucomicrobiales bacterium]
MNPEKKSPREILRRRLAWFNAGMAAAWLFFCVGLTQAWTAPPAAAPVPAAQPANPQPAAPSDDADTTGGKGQPKNFWELLVAGGPVMIPLAIFSIMGLASSFERAISLSRDRVVPGGFLAGLEEKISGGNVKAGISYCEQEGRETPLGEMMKAGLEKAHQGTEQVEKAVEEAGIRGADRMKRSLRLISLVVAIAPLLGLVGTVYGMIDAFRDLSNLQEGASKSDALSAGIYVALVTTATGLTIAIPFLAVYHFLSSKVDRLVEDMSIEARRFIDICPTGDQVAIAAAEPAASGGDAGDDTSQSVESPALAS